METAYFDFNFIVTIMEFLLVVKINFGFIIEIIGTLSLHLIEFCFEKSIKFATMHDRILTDVHYR